MGRGASLAIARIGAQPAVKGGAENSPGDVKVEARFQQSGPARVGGATVTFQPGARTAWHTHPLGQTLIVTAGIGWVQREGGPKQTIRAGDVVLIPASSEALARRHCRQRDDSRRGGRVARWQCGHMDGTCNQ